MEVLKIQNVLVTMTVTMEGAGYQGSLLVSSPNSQKLVALWIPVL